MSPSTLVQPLTSKETVNVPAATVNDFDVMLPVLLPVPILTAPPALYALETVGKLSFPSQEELLPLVPVLFPTVIEEKSSSKSLSNI